MAKETLVVNGATLSCSIGSTPAPLTASGKMNKAQGMDIADIQDFALGTNIPTFGTCPNLGPGPCAPTIPAPWTGGCSKVMSGGNAALKSSSTLTCGVGGTISVDNEGQTKVSGE